MSQLFIIKICFTIKVNTICGAGRDTRNLCHEFISQGPALSILSLRAVSHKSHFQGPSSRVRGVKFPRPRVPNSQSPRVPGSRFWVSGPNFRLCQWQGSFSQIKDPKIFGIFVFQVCFTNNNR